MPVEIAATVLRATLDPAVAAMVVDLSVLAATIRADTAKMQQQLSDLWLLMVPPAGHA